MKRFVFFLLRHLNFIISEVFIILAVCGFSVSFVEGAAFYVMKGNGGGIFTTIIIVIGSPLLTFFLLSVRIACLSSGQNLGHGSAILGFEVKVVCYLFGACWFCLFAFLYYVRVIPYVSV